MIDLPHRHPAYLAGHEWCKNPTRSVCPYDTDTDDYAMWRLAVEDYGIYLRATGQVEIEEIEE